MQSLIAVCPSNATARVRNIGHVSRCGRAAHVNRRTDPVITDVRQLGQHGYRIAIRAPRHLIRNRFQVATPPSSSGAIGIDNVKAGLARVDNVTDIFERIKGAGIGDNGKVFAIWRCDGRLDAARQQD